jgi:hypothetical protein
VNIKNTANDNAQVGQQIGVVYGNNSSSGVFTRQEVDLSTQLVGLRRAMADARCSNEIDDAEARAIANEIDMAAECLPLDGKDSAGRFVLAMKRAKGLAEGLADVTMKITAAIAAARGML